jgi:hypothetical protein
MSNVVGPISAEDWETMIALRRSIKEMAEDKKYAQQLRREKKWYRDIFEGYFAA